MRVLFTTTELPETAWDGFGWWVGTQYHLQRCRTGSDMRSHVALLFEDVPWHLRTAPGGSSHSALGAADVSFDLTSRPFCGFTRMDDPASWYSQFPGAIVDAYEIVAQDQHALALRAHAAATRMAENAPPYNDSWKWNATYFPWWPFPGASFDARPRRERGTNCVGATLQVLEEAREADLGLAFNFEAYLPGLLPEQLQAMGVLGPHLKRLDPGGPRMTRL